MDMLDKIEDENRTTRATPVEVGHECCEHAKEYFDQAEEAWAALARFERQFLALANGLRGMDRTLNRGHHHGRAANKEEPKGK